MRTLLLTTLLLTACGASGEAGSQAATDAATNVALQKADALDGTEDHVVHKCGGCALMMDGSEAHAVEHGEYTLHFCSASCKAGFEADPEAGVTSIAKAAAKGE